MIAMPQTASAQEDAAAMKNAVCKLLAIQKQQGQSSRVAGAAYQAGVDVNGNAVVPVDVNATPQSQSIIIPIEIDLAERFDIPDLGETQVSTAEIQSDGRVMFAQNDVTGKIHDWCGTPVPEDLDIQKPEIETPVVEKPKIKTTEINGPMVEVKQPTKVELQPVEIKPIIAQLPFEIKDNKASDDTNLRNIIPPQTNISDKITGTDYRDYNE